MKILAYLSLTFFAMISCGEKRSADPSVKTTSSSAEKTVAKLDTVTTLSKLNSDSAVFKAPNGNFYLIFREDDNIKDDEDRFKDSLAAFVSESNKAISEAVSNKSCDSDIFDGKDRKAAKISVANATAETFDDLESLFTTLIDDETTSGKISSTGEMSNRVKEEKRNVTIEKTWLYTFKVQSDEDYHLIIGTTPDVNTAEFFNVEISGLPDENSKYYNKLFSAREAFFKFFGEDMNSCFGKSYTKNFVNTPFPVEITGSLFFDKFHFEQGGPIGPEWARGNTYWEIHPITAITFLRN